MDKVERFLNLFSDFDLVVQPRRQRPVSDLQEVKEPGATKAQLKKALKRLEKQYQSAMKAFKVGKITKSELYDFEWRIFELQEEIKKLEERE